MARTPGPDPVQSADPEVPKTAPFSNPINRLFLFFSTLFLLFFFIFKSLERETPVSLYPCDLRRGPSAVVAAVAAVGGLPAKRKAPEDGSNPPGYGSSALFSQIFVVLHES